MYKLFISMRFAQLLPCCLQLVAVRLIFTAPQAPQPQPAAASSLVSVRSVLVHRVSLLLVCSWFRCPRRWLVAWARLRRDPPERAEERSEAKAAGGRRGTSDEASQGHASRCTTRRCGHSPPSGTSERSRGRLVGRSRPGEFLRLLRVDSAGGWWTTAVGRLSLEAGLWARASPRERRAVRPTGQGQGAGRVERRARQPEERDDHEPASRLSTHRATATRRC